MSSERRYTPAQLTVMCDSAVTARTREIVTRLQAVAPYYAELIEREFLGEAIPQSETTFATADDLADYWLGENGTQRRGG